MSQELLLGGARNNLCSASILRTGDFIETCDYTVGRIAKLRLKSDFRKGKMIFFNLAHHPVQVETEHHADHNEPASDIRSLGCEVITRSYENERPLE